MPIGSALPKGSVLWFDGTAGELVGVTEPLEPVLVPVPCVMVVGVAPLIGDAPGETPAVGDDFTPAAEVAVEDGEAVRVTPGVGVGVWFVTVGDGVFVTVGEGVLVMVGDGVFVTVGDGVVVTVGDGVVVMVGDGVVVTVGDGVLVSVGTIS